MAPRVRADPHPVVGELLERPTVEQRGGGAIGLGVPREPGRIVERPRYGVERGGPPPCPELGPGELGDGSISIVEGKRDTRARTVERTSGGNVDDGQPRLRDPIELRHELTTGDGQPAATIVDPVVGDDRQPVRRQGRPWAPSANGSHDAADGSRSSSHGCMVANARNESRTRHYEARTKKP
jgi:hypothetical protein